MVVYLGEVSGGEDLDRTGGVPLCLTDSLSANALCVQLPTKFIVLRKKNNWRGWGRDGGMGRDGGGWRGWGGWGGGGGGEIGKEGKDR